MEIVAYTKIKKINDLLNRYEAIFLIKNSLGERALICSYKEDTANEMAWGFLRKNMSEMNWDFEGEKAIGREGWYLLKITRNNLNDILRNKLIKKIRIERIKKNGITNLDVRPKDIKEFIENNPGFQLNNLKIKELHS